MNPIEWMAFLLTVLALSGEVGFWIVRALVKYQSWLLTIAAAAGTMVAWLILWLALGLFEKRGAVR